MGRGVLRGVLRGLTASLLLMLGVGAACADAYPSRLIRFVVPWPAGGATDVIARQLGQALSAQVGQPVVVENKPGAGGNVGTQAFVRERPDGYAIIMATSSTNAANPHLYSRLGFDPVADFTPVAFVAEVPNVLVVPASSPFRSVQELVAHARANPGQLTYGSGGTGASQHLAGEQFKSVLGIDVVHVPYKGSAPAAADLMGGHVSLMLDTGSLPNIRSGKLRALAVAAKARVPALADVPTFDELGIPGLYASAWYGIMLPAGAPAEVVARLNREFNAALQNPEVRQRLIEFGAEVGGGTPDAFAAFSRAEIDRYRDIVKLSGAKLD